MATVHRALERGIEGFERIVALKRLLPHLAEDASFIKSFVREAKLASLLNHNNIVQIFELGRVGTEYFISMEHIDGRDIRRILRHARKVTGPPPIHVTTGLLLQLCDALDYAHSKVDAAGNPLQLVHRDVSPSNLLVTSAGHLKVIDFGIAKAQSSQLRTQTGRVKGKLAYMAPEAITGKELDSRSDLFAAGVIGHELLTARPLFASKNEYQTLLKVQHDDIMLPSTFNHACPRELDAIVLTALARVPDDRFETAAQMRDALLAMRKKYNLETGHRDIAQWLDWAFSLEPPNGGFAALNTPEPSGSVRSGSFDVEAAARAMANRPRTRARTDEDAAVEIAWGGGEQEQQAVVLDDVPDVTDKTPVPRRTSTNDTRPAMPNRQLSALLIPRVPPAKPGVAAPLQAAGAAGLPAPEPEPVYAPVFTEPANDLDIVDLDPLTLDRLPFVAAAEPIPTVPTPPPTVARQVVGPRRTWPLVVGLFVLGLAATAFTLYMTRGEDTVASVSESTSPALGKKPGTVKFAIEPDDIEITIEGRTHKGSPWSVQLEPGIYSVRIHKDGFKERVTSIELSANETTTMMISLERAGAQATGDANLILSSTPAGLEVMIDGKLQKARTPFKGPLTVGAHVIALRQNGFEVWKQELVAQANVDHEFSPAMTEDKLRERKRRVVPPRPIAERVVPVVPPESGPPEPRTLERIEVDAGVAVTPQVVLPPPPVVTPEPPPAPEKPVIVPPPAAIMVAPTAVTRISGDIPTFNTARSPEIPPIIAAKVCINAGGGVTSVAMLTKLEAATANGISATLRGWRYAPYTRTGTAVSVCFAVSFRVK